MFGRNTREVVYYNATCESESVWLENRINVFARFIMRVTPACLFLRRGSSFAQTVHNCASVNHSFTPSGET